MRVRVIRQATFRLAAILGLAAMVPCHAQTLPDPTRPAPAWLAAQARVTGGAAAGVAEVAAPEQPIAPGVRIVVTGPTRKFAIVDGEAVRPGESYNGSRLASIDPDGVTWQKGGAQEKSSMSPDVQKTEPGKPRPQQARPSAKKKPMNGEGQ